MIKELISILLSGIYRGRNVRLPGLAHVEEMYLDIRENGLKHEPMVYAVGDLYEVIQGHLRIENLERLAKEEPARFAELFPGGAIPCLLLSGCTYEEAQLEKLDHGQENPLMNPMEVQLSMNFLFDAQKTEAQIAVQLSGLMNRVSPMKANKKKELDQLERDIEMYRETGRFTDIAEKERQATQLKLDYRKGKIQNCKAIWEAPHVVMATMWYKATGGERNWGETLDIEIAEDVYLPSALQVDAVKKKLKPAFAKDLLIKENGVCPFNKRVPGPNFNAAWDEACAKSKTAESADKPVREKAFGKADLEAEESKWLSAGFSLLCAHHRRDPDVNPTTLAELDKNAYLAELVAERGGDEWTQFVALAKNLETLKIAEQKEIEAKTPTTPPTKVAATDTSTEEKSAKVIRKAGAAKRKDKRAAAK